MARYHEWVRRALQGQLGVGDELWTDVSSHPAFARLEAIARRGGRSLDAGDISYGIHRTLLLNVIHAAGGIEYTVGKLLMALEVEQRATADRCGHRLRR